MLRTLLFLLLAATVTGVKTPTYAAERTITFDELPRLIKERNENVQAAEAHLKASGARTGYLIRSFLPQISGSAGVEEFKTGTNSTDRKDFWSVQGKINVFRGGRDWLESDIRKLNEKKARAEYSIEKNNELKEARFAYWGLVAISKVTSDLKETLSRTENYIKSARRRAGAGVSTTADALQFELQRTLIQQDLKKLSLEEDLLKNKLSVAVGLDEHENLNVSGDFPHPPETVSNETVDPKMNLEVQALESVQNVEALRKKQASRWWVPQLDVYSKYAVPSLDDEYTSAIDQDKELTVGVMVTLDLGGGLEGHSESRAKKYEALASERRAAHRVREVKATDHELRHDMKLIHELIHDADRDIEKAEQFLKLTNNEYSRGVKNGPDLLEASQKLYEFKERRTSLYRQYHQAEAELQALTDKGDR